MRRVHFVASIVAILSLGQNLRADDAASPTPATPTQSSPASPDLTSLSLEDLMNIQVTSVSKQKQRIAEAPAAIYVITADDVRNSGLSSIPELLRLSPGMHVARLNAGDWAISSRGFNNIYANKLLVMMDGRTVYTPLFSGVYWHQHDAILEDLDRIEVIRGPGATLWGANAVNGVINITSKPASETQGALVTGRLGTHEAVGGVRYGGAIGEHAFYRVYAKYRDVTDHHLPGEMEAHDEWEAVRSGFRIDLTPSESDLWTFQGDVFSAQRDQTLVLAQDTPPLRGFHPVSYDSNGGDLIGRWTHTDEDDSEFSLQVYYDRIDHEDADVLELEQDTLDLDLQHRFRLTDRQQIVWGAGYRYVDSQTRNTRIVRLDPEDRQTHLANFFIQDDVTLVPDRLHLFLGSKFEVNSFSGFEIQPSARMLWTPSEQHSLWAAVSRAVRTPSRADEDASVNSVADPELAGVAVTADVFPNPGINSEKLIAYELGYRFQPNKRLSLDVAAFVNHYDDLVTYVPGGEPTVRGTPPHLVIPVQTTNDLFGETYGVEVSGTAILTDQWRVTGSYTLLRMEIHGREGSTAGPAQELLVEGASPRNQFQVRSHYDITRRVRFNTSLFYADQLDFGPVPAYWRLDANLAWRPTDSSEISVGVQNALDPHHPEFGNGNGFNLSTEVERSVYVQATFKF